MKVAIVHDDLVQWGGAERILLGLCEIFPTAKIFTTVVDFQNENIRKNFTNKKINTSFIQNIPFWRDLYKVLLPLYPIAFEQFNFDGFDLVISHTTRFAKCIITKPETLHISYCHTPPRFLWRFSGISNFGLGELLMTKLRIFDQITSRRVDSYIAGSNNAKKRIKKVYREDSNVVYPFVDFKRFENIKTFDGGYFLVIGRPKKYKRFDLAIDACLSLNQKLKIIDGHLSDELVTKVLAGCMGLIMSGEEDFGLISLEAQALGKPVIAYKSGGALETIVEGKTGIFFEHQDVECLKKAIEKFHSLHFNPNDCIQNAVKFSKERFMKEFKQTVASLLYTR